MEITQTISRLQEGNKRFIADKLDGKLQDSSRRENLVGGQEPYAIILSCADSRVVPELVFDTGLGELFVVRVAGNIANTDSIASIEYAVAHCGSKVIIVLGHESCGAVTAAVKGGDNGYNLNHLLSQITPAVESSSSDNIDEVVKTNAKKSAEDLMDRSKIISEFVNKGEVKVIPAYYHFASGEVEFLDK